MPKAKEPFETLSGRYTELVAKLAANGAPELAASTRDVARGAFDNAEVGATPQERLALVRDAVSDHLAKNTFATKGTAAQAFDAANAGTAAPDTTADSVASAASDAASSVASPPGISLKLSQPSMLSATNRVVFRAVSAVIAVLAGAALLTLGLKGDDGTGTITGLTIGLAGGLLVVLVLVMGYGDVEIDGTKAAGGTSSSSSS